MREYDWRDFFTPAQLSQSSTVQHVWADHKDDCRCGQSGCA